MRTASVKVSEMFRRALGLLVIPMLVGIVPSVARGATCATVAACVFGQNTAAGIGVGGTSVSGHGVEGDSKSGFGVVGTTRQNATAASNAKAGVEGIDESTNGGAYDSGVYGGSSTGSGVFGAAKSGTGVQATSGSGNAATFVAGGPQFTGIAGAGLFAQSTINTGVVGVGNTNGVIGFASLNCVAGATSADYYCPPKLTFPTTPAGLTGETDEGGVGLNILTDTGTQGDPLDQSGMGIFVDAGSTGMYLMNDRGANGDVTDLFVAGTLGGRDPPSSSAGGVEGAVIIGSNALSATGTLTGVAASAQTAVLASSNTTLFQGTTIAGKTVADLDAAGNLTLAGKVTQHGSFTTTLRNTDGTSTAAFGTESTRPVLEDMGESALVGGTAFVPIDAALAKSADASNGYLVFLTPQGDTSGLYVSAKSWRGFSVREIGNGRRSLAFDYRIVARPYAQPGERLARVDDAIKARAPGRLFYRHVGKLRFVHGKLDKSSLPQPSL